MELLLEERGPVALLTLNRPSRLNALSTSLLQALEKALNEVEARPHLRAVVLAGAGRVFCAGADIAELKSKAGALAAAAYIEQIQRVVNRVEALPLPVIAAVHGLAFGGGFELALAADLIVAEDQTQFALPEVKIGVIPGAGGTQRLPRLVGRNRAKELLFSGDFIDAHRAEAWGIVNRVVPAGEAQSEALSWAASLAERAPVALRLAKRAVNRGLETSLEAGLDLEMEAILILFGTRDQKEGMQAFLEKRAPQFIGE